MINKTHVKILVSLLFLLNFSNLFSEKIPEIIYRPQTKEEAFSYVMECLSISLWFKENGYNIGFPKHKDFAQAYHENKVVNEKEKEHLKQIFYNKIYDVSVFDESLKKISQTKTFINEILEKLVLLEKNWGFQLKPKYEVLLTLYGPGGSYYPEKNIGKIIIHKNNMKRSIATIIAHEIVHIGIEEDIVKQYNLEHWEKERLVDLICSLYLKDFFPNYKIQQQGEKTIN
ncbi:hypothetical protein ACFLYH_00325 [Candidatus Dependentiae bacterium]